MDFDKARKERLREAYDAAVAEGKEQFVFDGAVLVVGYAKYLLEYLDMKLP
jgi:hypothetical protein